MRAAGRWPAPAGGRRPPLERAAAFSSSPAARPGAPILRAVSLSKQILAALLAGVAVGLFFGDKVAFLEIGGRAFVQVLQVTVLPYVAGSLIAGFGSMRRRTRACSRRAADSCSWGSGRSRSASCS